MDNSKNSKFLNIIIASASVILAGVAVFSALSIYRSKTNPIAPTAPEQSQAQDTTPEGCIPCDLTFFTINAQEPSNTPTATKTPTPTATSTPPASCNETCVENSDCSTGLTCTQTTSGKKCRNQSCSLETDCTCPGPSATPTATKTPTPTATKTPTPTGTLNPTSTPISTSTPTPTGTIRTVITSTPKPTTQPDALPDAGIPYPTIIIFTFGVILLTFSILLAL